MRISFLLIACFMLTSCAREKPFSKILKIENGSFNGLVTIEFNKELSKYSITSRDTITGQHDRIFTPYEIFQAEYADINHDGKPDLLLGIIKPTPFDSVYRKRLFIFQIDRGYIRPLWLSSRLKGKLEEFAVANHCELPKVLTIEQQSGNRYSVNEYQWDSFGLSYLKNIDDSLKFSEAKRTLQSYKHSKNY